MAAVVYPPEIHIIADCENTILILTDKFKTYTEQKNEIETNVTLAVEKEADDRAAKGDKSLSNATKRQVEINTRLAAISDYVGLKLKVKEIEFNIKSLQIKRDQNERMFRWLNSLNYTKVRL